MLCVSIALPVFRIFWMTDTWEKLMPIPSREPSLLVREMPLGGEIWQQWANDCASASRSGVSLRYHFQHTQTFEQDPLILSFVSEPELLQSGWCEGFMIFCSHCCDLMLTSTETLTGEPWVQNRNNRGAEAALEWAGWMTIRVMEGSTSRAQVSYHHYLHILWNVRTIQWIPLSTP